MANTKTKKEEGIDILEDPDVLAGKAEEFFNSKRNQTLVFGIGGVLALIVLAFVGYKYYITNQNTEAQKEMFQAVYYFEADSLGKALNGDGINFGFLDIIEDYSGTDAANLSNFYAGATYMKLGDFSSAIRYLDNFSSSDYLLQARAYALIGDANMELGDYPEAVSAYESAAGYKPNEDFTPVYLTKLAIAQESAGSFGAAVEAYSKIIDEYANSSLVQDAKKHKARLQGLAAE
ncbi:MAG: tetratricopeptide repeat protein [Marinoscillum sp.]